MRTKNRMQDNNHQLQKTVAFYNNNIIILNSPTALVAGTNVPILCAMKLTLQPPVRASSGGPHPGLVLFPFLPSSKPLDKCVGFSQSLDSPLPLCSSFPISKSALRSKFGNFNS